MFSNDSMQHLEIYSMATTKCPKSCPGPVFIYLSFALFCHLNREHKREQDLNWEDPDSSDGSKIDFIET